MKKTLRAISALLGFEKLNRAERDYLHDANIRTSAYMGVIVVLLEAWMLFRQIFYKVIPRVEAGAEPFGQFVKYTSKYWLFLLIGLGLTLFCTYQRKKKISKGQFAALMTVGGLCVAYTAVLSLESFTRVSESVTPVMANIMNAMLVSIYVFLFAIGVTIVAYAWTRYRRGRRVVALEHLAIIGFNLVCLAFGVYVSYSDFWGGKEIICFLTMVIYVGCLLIYRPYMTLLILGAGFWAFHAVLMTYQGGLSFAPNDVVVHGIARQVISGDSVNYWTFFISLSTICFAIYHGRLSEARKSEALIRTARRDRLTDLYSYRYFTERAEERMRSAEEPLSDLIYLFIDVHNFKAFNDQRGFEEGNRFLVAVGGMIAELFPDSLYARQADDHYVALTKTEALPTRLEELNRRVHDYDPEIRLGINCGGYHPAGREEDPRVAIDRARYAAKTIRNRFQDIYAEYDEAMSRAYHRRLYIVNNVENAVRNGWIVPFYQPVVRADSGKLCGCEALARWMDPVYGQLYPNEFIPMLEEYRLIHRLDRAIFEAACRDLRNALDGGLPVIPVSLNFSRLDFELMDAVGELEALTARYALPKELIHVEVTESALADDSMKLDEALNRVKRSGYALWLDDFGSGYSSLNVLKDYEFDMVKIDMRFLQNLENSEKAKTLLKCVVELADQIHMQTLTEGVETEAQARFLKEIGCSRLQGYLFGRPVPRDALYDRIARGELILHSSISDHA